MATRHFIPMLLLLWTTTDKDSLYLIDLEPQGGPILTLLMMTHETVQGFEALTGSLSSRKVGALDFARAMTGRVIQARQTISGSNPPEGIFAFSHNLVGVTEWFLDAMLNVASPMLRRTFERMNYLTEFALLLRSISLAFEKGRVPKDVQLSVHDLALLLKVVTGTIDRNYRAPHNWGRLVEGKIEETCTRILRDAPTKDGPAYGHMSPTLGALEFFSVYPAVVNHMIAWDHEGHNSIRNVAMHLPDTEHTIRLKQLLVEGAKRADIYSGFRDSHQLFICDNSSVVQWFEVAHRLIIPTLPISLYQDLSDSLYSL
ncbi:hypothetical protein FA13DRAFT_1797345 [Coprinellus micaceus]|uniref:Uncharacterized protein n=1 Tax=Coprinellus micaceus TaxID=71717 RepID=A0A4Y7SRG6_COPMI|nr:hypothetical protein FA13DRAFT_1797345 [Coprinellus micaceus]